MKIQLAFLWTAVLGTLSGSLWIFNNIAWAADLERIEVRLIKRDLRELRKEMRENPSEDLLEEIEELLDALCEIAPEDRECG